MMDLDLFGDTDRKVQEYREREFRKERALAIGWMHLRKGWIDYKTLIEIILIYGQPADMEQLKRALGEYVVQDYVAGLEALPRIVGKGIQYR